MGLHKPRLVLYLLSEFFSRRGMKSIQTVLGFVLCCVKVGLQCVMFSNFFFCQFLLMGYFGLVQADE